MRSANDHDRRDPQNLQVLGYYMPFVFGQQRHTDITNHVEGPCIAQVIDNLVVFSGHRWRDEGGSGAQQQLFAPGPLRG